ncbi:MAG: hypothetical protein WCT26_00035 [Candidatus Buchananbacteria bacterium]|jgi:hypothetical protein
MPNPEKMSPVKFHDPLDEERAKKARTYEGSKINETTPDGIPVYITPRPDKMDEQLKQRNQEDFELAEKNREYIANEK